MLGERTDRHTLVPRSSWPEDCCASCVSLPRVPLERAADASPPWGALTPAPVSSGRRGGGISMCGSSSSNESGAPDADSDSVDDSSTMGPLSTGFLVRVERRTLHARAWGVRVTAAARPLVPFGNGVSAEHYGLRTQWLLTLPVSPPAYFKGNAFLFVILMLLAGGTPQSAATQGELKIVATQFTGRVLIGSALGLDRSSS